MKLFIALSLLVSTLARAQLSEELSVESVIGLGALRATFPQEWKNPVGKGGEIYLQRGARVARNRVDDSFPSCKLQTNTFGSTTRLPNALFLANQELAATSMQMSSGGLRVGPIGRRRTSFSLTFTGSLQDAARAGVPAAEVEIAELLPGTLNITLECRKFRTESPTIAELREVLGISVFNLSLTDRPYDPMESNRNSVTVRRLQTERAARAEGQLTAAGPAIPTTTELTSLNNTAVVRLGAGLESFVERPNRSIYLGTIFQNGKKAGAVDVAGRDYGLVSRELDSEDPTCRVMASRFRAVPTDISVPLQAGNFRVKSTEFFANIRRGSMTLEAIDPLTGVGMSEVVIRCSNVSTLADIQSALGAERILIHQTLPTEEVTTVVTNVEASPIDNSERGSEELGPTRETVEHAPTAVLQ